MNLENTIFDIIKILKIEMGKQIIEKRKYQEYNIYIYYK